MEKTQNFFEKVRARIKKYRFNWSTKQVEHDEFVEIEHVNHGETLNKDKRRLFKMRGSAVVVCTFLVLVGAGAVDAQTRAYEVIYKGTSIGYIDSLEVLEAAVGDTSADKSGRRNREGSDYEIRTARSTDFLTTEEVTQVITAIRTEEKNNQPEVLVARVDNVEPAAATASQETPITDAEKLQTGSVAAVVEEEPILEPETNTASVAASHTSETPVNQATETPAVVAEVPVEDVPVIEAPVTEVVVEDIQPETSPVDEAPVVDTPVVEAPTEENPITEPPITDIPEEPVAELPAVEAPAAETPAVEPAKETPQAQFMIPASGRVGEILRDYDGGYYSNHYRAAAVDILNSEGTDIYAAASGTVTLSSWYGGYGKCVIIDHGNGYSTLYGHFSSVDVVEGQAVTQGQRIGGMGSTGSSTANHVHFEVRVNDEAQPIGNYFNISTGDYV